MLKIAMFGGTFNPIHNGHINTALYFKKSLSLDKVIFIPTAIPPHKTINDEIDSKIRYNMCLIETDKYAFFETSDIEMKRQGKSYTIDTLKELKKKYTDAKLYIIMGADMFMTIEKWKDYEQIFELATICTVPRNEITYSKLKDHSKEFKGKAECIISDKPVMDVSSSEIRKRISRKEDISSFVSKDVEKYIYKNELYSR